MWFSLQYPISFKRWEFKDILVSHVFLPCLPYPISSIPVFHGSHVDESHVSPIPHPMPCGDNFLRKCFFPEEEVPTRSGLSAWKDRKEDCTSWRLLNSGDRTIIVFSYDNNHQLFHATALLHLGSHSIDNDADIINCDCWCDKTHWETWFWSILWNCCWQSNLK